MLTKPRWIDFFILTAFTILITLHPFFLFGDINLFELSLYLPGIDAILDGKIPYRDFFHLRGPLELYIPVFFMKIFGENVAVLSAYFYVGTVLTLIFTILVAKEFFQTRLFLYLMVPVMIARTFPRVVFSYWGGIRYGFGFLALFFIFRYLKSKRLAWIFAAGLTTALAFLTSIEIGVCVLLGLLGAQAVVFIFEISERNRTLRCLLIYILGVLCIIIPFFIYMYLHQALGSYLDATYAVVFNMQKVIDLHLSSVFPGTLLEALLSMFNPGSTNFKHMTPAYLYLFFSLFLIWKKGKEKFNTQHVMAISLGIYGLVMYVTSFRAILGSQFEMALQPEKILLFFILEAIILLLLRRKTELQKEKASPALEGFTRHHRTLKIIGINLFFVLIIVAGSIAYPIQRFNKRFFIAKFFKSVVTGKDLEDLKPIAKDLSRPLMIERADRMTVSKSQADEIEMIVEYVEETTDVEDPILIFPEWGIYSFLFDRPFPGRFPVVTLSWLNDNWHNEFLIHLKSSPPKVAIVAKEHPAEWVKIHLSPPANRKKYQDVLDFIHNNYVLRKTTARNYIYQSKAISKPNSGRKVIPRQ